MPPMVDPTQRRQHSRTLEYLTVVLLILGTAVAGGIVWSFVLPPDAPPPLGYIEIETDRCVGVLALRADIVLTAGHCVAHTRGATQSLGDDRFSIGGSVVAVAEWAARRTTSEGLSRGGVDDIALVHLAGTAPHVPAAFDPELSTVPASVHFWHLGHVARDRPLFVSNPRRVDFPWSHPADYATEGDSGNGVFYSNERLLGIISGYEHTGVDAIVPLHPHMAWLDCQLRTLDETGALSLDSHCNE